MPIPAIFAALAKAGLGLLGNAVLAKGKQVIEDKIGVKIPDDPAELQNPAVVKELQQAQFAHEEFLINAAIKEKELELAAEEKQEGERTKRWLGDMQSDSWLSKNVRPITLVYWTVALTLLIILDSALDVFKVDPLWIDLIKISYLTILGAYFVIRGLEKGTSMVTKVMEKRNVSRR
jgi:hypothetical protein